MKKQKRNDMTLSENLIVSSNIIRIDRGFNMA